MTKHNDPCIRIEDLEHEIAELEREAARLDRENTKLVARWEKHISVPRWKRIGRKVFKNSDGYVRAWVIVVSVLAVCVLIIGGTLGGMYYTENKARNKVLDMSQVVVGCAEDRADVEYICITNEMGGRRLLYCESDGCYWPELKKPENL